MVKLQSCPWIYRL